ncbi:MAG: glycosyltransferase family 4 protein [Vibrionaceae bacterium]|nr:glycosyltransferase family 4 protein [Vibrionaceae bacterium]
MRKILLVVPLTTLQWGSKNSGGVDSVCQMLVEQLTKSSSLFHYRILAFDPKNEVEYDGKVLQLSDNVEVVRSPTKSNKGILSSVGLWYSNARVWEQVRDYNPDLVHSHIPSWLFGALQAKYKVATLHSYKRIARKPVSALNDLLYERVVPFALERIVDGYTCVGKMLNDALTEDVTKPIDIVPNPINVRFFDSRRTSKGRQNIDTIKLVTCALITRRKRVHEALKLVKSLYAQGVKAELTVIGPDCEPDYYLELKSYVKENNLDQAVHFVGQCNQQQIIEHYQNAHVGVFFSAEETFGLAPLEMAASGLPVISTRVGILEESDDWLAFSNLKLISLGRETIKAHEVIELVHSQTPELRKYIGNRFQVNNIVRSYEDVYTQYLQDEVPVAC